MLRAVRRQPGKSYGENMVHREPVKGKRLFAEVAHWTPPDVGT
jgi:hypothetical protein